MQEPEFKDMSPRTFLNSVLDNKNEYYFSEATLYRALKKKGFKFRKCFARKKARKAPELKAKRPNQIYCWDITYLKSRKKGKYYYLYLVIDLYSRYVVGYSIEKEQSAQKAKVLFERILQRNSCKPEKLIVHSDNGSPMTGDVFQNYMKENAIEYSFSRPHTSDDNPYSESIFSTIKSAHTIPEYFENKEEAECILKDIVDFYNNKHMHSGINFIAPTKVYFGTADKIMRKRNEKMKQIRQKHPERFGGKIRIHKVPETVYLGRVREAIKN